MAVWSKITNLFNNYREQNSKQTIEQYSNDRFGQDAKTKNPNLEVFSNAQNNVAEIVDRRSVISRFHSEDVDRVNPFSSSVFSGIDAMPLITNKAERIRQYRSMAQYPECDFCLCELADDFLHEDEENEYIKLDLPEKSKLDETKKEIIQNEFHKFVDLFKLREESFNLIKRFLVDGEIAYENIINPNKPDLGIIGVKYLPTEYYETLVNPYTGKAVGITFDKENLDRDVRTILSNSAVGAKAIFNNMVQSSSIDFNKANSIPLLWPQLTYISSGDCSPDGLINFPLIEKCKMAYHQLALMQDAAVILRVTRAPERLLFNVNVAGMADKVARAKLKEFENEYKSKKILSNNNGHPEVTTQYNPVTMLECFFSGKTNANDGTTVETVSSSADYEQIADIEFFLRRLFKQFKVPFSRFKVPENELSRNDTINYEEYSMSRQEIRIQRRVAMGIKRSFITHLKLRNLWDKYKLKETDLDIHFIKPVLWDLYETQKLVTAKMEIYEKCVEQDELSKITAMKKYLGMSDEEIDLNFTNLIKEKQYVAMTDYFGDMIGEEHRPVDYTSPIRLSGIDGVEAEKQENPEGGEGGQEESPGSGDGEEPKMPSADNSGEQGGDTGEPSFGLGGGDEGGQPQ